MSKMPMLGLARWMIKCRIKKGNAVSLEKLMADSRELGRRISACDLIMEITGIKPKDLRQDR